MVKEGELYCKKLSFEEWDPINQSCCNVRVTDDNTVIIQNGPVIIKREIGGVYCKCFVVGCYRRIDKSRILGVLPKNQNKFYIKVQILEIL